LTMKNVNLPGMSDKDKLAKLQAVKSAGSHYKPAHVRYAYAKLSALKVELIQNLTALYGTNAVFVINVVRPNWNVQNKIGTNLTISHQAFLVLQNGKPTRLRHASSAAKMVTESDWNTYVDSMTQVPSIKGIQVLNVLAAPAASPVGTH